VIASSKIAGLGDVQFTNIIINLQTNFRFSFHCFAGHKTPAAMASICAISAPVWVVKRVGGQSAMGAVWRVPVGSAFG